MWILLFFHPYFVLLFLEKHSMCKNDILKLFILILQPKKDCEAS